ncbi:MAG: TIGR02646 family protein [Burkholderiales bacterium RIFCSPLOWO2_12_FULL_61_40]|nr:MAG: TIGR02646 family protein [Burkholderiales bacterium RIFCSPLOWO2_12_FULL_61_40]
MRVVRKNAAPDAFLQWMALANKEWVPSFSGLQKPEKPALHQALIAEQHGLCCYCGRSITSESSHIEHFHPQHAYPQLALDYGNLFASCIRETGPRLPLHCGHAKAEAFRDDLQISPLDPGCEQRFRYALDGHILPQQSDDEAAIYMADLLALDIEFLQTRRKEVLEGMFDDEFLLTASRDELQAICHFHRTPDAAGTLPVFAHVIVRFAEQLLEKS